MSIVSECIAISSFFFFNDTATTEIYTLSLHDALPISAQRRVRRPAARRRQDPRAQGDHQQGRPARRRGVAGHEAAQDRKSTRLNSSHANISYAVFCLKKKKTSNYVACTVQKSKPSQLI